MIPHLRSEGQYVVPLAIILLIEYLLIITILYALQQNNIIYKSFYEGKHFNNLLTGHGGHGGSIVMSVIRGLFLIMLLIIVGYHYIYQPYYMKLKYENWLLYNQWSLLLVTLYYFMVTILSIRKVLLNKSYVNETPLIDPILTKLTSLLFSLSGTVVIVSLIISIYDNKTNIVYLDIIILFTILIEICFNNFCVTISDIFLSLSFAFIYIIVLFILVVLFDKRDWPYSFFQLEDRWCLARYNVFILTHIVSFMMFYMLCNMLTCGRARKIPKINPMSSFNDQNKMSDVDDEVRVFENDDEDDDNNIENQKSTRPKSITEKLDDELQEQYCDKIDDDEEHSQNRKLFTGDLTAEEEKELKKQIGKLSYQLNKQVEKYDKLKHSAAEKDIKVKQLEADLQETTNRLQMLVAQQKEILDERIALPAPSEQPVEQKRKQSIISVNSEMLRNAGVVNCPGCEKEYKVNDDLTLVELNPDEDVAIIESANQHKKELSNKITEPFITKDVDKSYFKHVLLSEFTKETRQRAKKLGISIYYKSDDKQQKVFKLKKDLQNEIYLVCTGELLYPSRIPEAIEEEKKLEMKGILPKKWAGNNDGEEDAEQDDCPETTSPLNNTLVHKKVVLYKHKRALKETLQAESIDDIRARAEDLNIDIYYEDGSLKLKKDLKAEIYGEMTGDNIYDDIHSMVKMNHQVLKD